MELDGILIDTLKEALKKPIVLIVTLKEALNYRNPILTKAYEPGLALIEPLSH